MTQAQQVDLKAAAAIAYIEIGKCKAKLEQRIATESNLENADDYFYRTLCFLEEVSGLVVSSQARHDEEMAQLWGFCASFIKNNDMPEAHQPISPPVKAHAQNWIEFIKEIIHPKTLGAILIGICVGSALLAWVQALWG